MNSGIAAHLVWDPAAVATPERGPPTTVSALDWVGQQGRTPEQETPQDAADCCSSRLVDNERREHEPDGHHEVAPAQRPGHLRECDPAEAGSDRAGHQR